MDTFFKLFLISSIFFSNISTQKIEQKTPHGTNSEEDGIKYVARIFEKYQTVGLSELHGNKEIWDYIKKLVSDEEFIRRVRNIGFEGGNSLYQELMDKYVYGAEISLPEIKKIWRDNSQINSTFDAPVYLDFIQFVRNLNTTLPQERKIRIILLDPPIDWQRVRGRDDYFPVLMQREPVMAGIIKEQVYNKNEKILFIGGALHVGRSKSDSELLNALSMLEKSYPGTTYSIGYYNGFGLSNKEASKLEQRFENWQKPVICELKSHWLGELDADMNIGGGLPGSKLRENFDGFLFIGKRDELTTSDPSLVLCTGKEEEEKWIELMLKRQEMVGRPPFLKDDRKKICTPMPVKYYEKIKNQTR